MICIECGQPHKQEYPHDAMTAQYAAWCISHYKRLPTWQDAIAHCDEKMRGQLKTNLIAMGCWTTYKKPTGIKRPKLALVKEAVNEEN